jgi:cytochrome c biogenesis protein CcmG/thiol:disulfide interchange protein DsbE
MNRSVFIIGIVVAAVMIALLVAGLGRNPSEIQSPLIGKAAPTFALRQVGTGQTLDLTQFRGKPVVINFWATWCVPCYEEHPVLVRGAQMLGSDVQFVGVVFDDTEEKIMSFLNERGSSYPTLVDVAGKTAIAYGVGGVPETFFLDATGKVVAKFSGPLTPDQLAVHVRKALGR